MKLKKQSLRNIKAILWDMDGVLVDSEDMHPILESETAKHFGMDFSPEKVRELYLGVQLENEFNDMIKKSGQSNVTYDQMRKIRDRLLKEYLEKGINSIPHAEEVVSSLSSQYKQALVSSGERFWGENALDKLKLLKYFNVVIFGEDVENHKPYPEPFLKAARVLGLNPSECLVVEDSWNGLQAGKGAGMKVIGYKTSHNQDLDFSLADFVIEDLREIPGILDTKLI
ncbi:HAD family phosphatase [Candidatus Daviesbacteria bacterium]|nr:HAD family phosphatase [Candidatus Daviesbacteria bacterium]